MKEYCRRKHLVYSTCFCWCPVLWNCNQCLINKHPDNIYYTSYYINFVCCCHGNYMFCTASRSGELFLWNLTYHKKDATKHKLEISFVHESQIEWPFSLAWYQVSPKDSKKTIVFVFLLYLLNDELNIHRLIKIPTYNHLIMFQCWLVLVTQTVWLLSTISKLIIQKMVFKQFNLSPNTICGMKKMK